MSCIFVAQGEATKPVPDLGTIPVWSGRVMPDEALMRELPAVVGAARELGEKLGEPGEPHGMAWSLVIKRWKEDVREVWTARRAYCSTGHASKQCSWIFCFALPTPPR